MKSRPLHFILSLSYPLFFSCSENPKCFEEIPANVNIDEYVQSSMSEIKNEHPTIYFDLVNLLYENGHYDEAALAFYVGNYSYKLYNHANPNCKKSDQRQFDLVSFTYGYEIYQHLQSDLDHYSEIVFESRNWYSKHPPHYFNNEKEQKHYKRQLVELNEFAVELRDTPEEYWRKLDKEKEDLERKMNRALEQAKKERREIN